MLAAVVLLLALLRPSLGDDSNGYLSFLDSPDVEKFGAALNAREVVNKLIAMGADCEKEEAAVRGQYVDEERIALKQYEELGGSEETYARLITDLLEAEERDVERVRAACVSQQREYLHSLVKEVLEYYSFLIDVDSAEAATFLKQADNYWETIRVGLDKCRQLYAKESDGLPPEVFSEEKMCRTEEVELLLEAFQSFVEQAVMMQGKGEGHSLEGYLPGILPVSPDKDAEGGEAAKTGSVESTDGPTDIEAYLPGILPVIPDNGQENKDVGKPIEETKEPTEETKEPTEKTKEPTEETKEPTEETKEPTEETKEPTEETKEPSEVSDELKDLEAYLPGILPVIPDWSGSGPMDDEKDQDPVEATEVSTQATETTEGPTEVPEGPTEATGGTGSPTDAKESDVVYEVFDSLNGERAGNSETKSPGASDSTPPQDASDGSLRESSTVSSPTANSQLHRSSVMEPSEGQAMQGAMHLVIWTCMAAVAMVLLAMVGVCVLAVLVRRQRSRLVQREPPLLKEKRHLNMIKEVGYINPTYRFHELQESKEHTYY